MKKKSATKKKKFDASQVLAGFKNATDADDAKYDKLLLDFIEENENSNRWNFNYYWCLNLKDSCSGKTLLGLSKKEKAFLIERIFHHICRFRQIEVEYEDAFYIYRNIGDKTNAIFNKKAYACIEKPEALLQVAIGQLIRSKLPFSEAQIQIIAGWICDTDTHILFLYPTGHVVNNIEYCLQGKTPNGKTKKSIQLLLSKFEELDHDRKMRELSTRLEKVLGIASEIPVYPGEAWSDTALLYLDKLNQPERNHWKNLLIHCQSASAGKPSKKWLSEAEAFINPLGEDEFCKQMLQWFPLVDKPRTNIIENYPGQAMMIIDEHADILKGLVWCCGLFENSDLVRALSNLAISTYKKVPGVGPRAVKIGNACIYALGAVPGMDAVGQLALLKVRVKFGTAQKGIEKALKSTAERVGIPREELEEMTVPAYGLSEVGLREESLGDFTAVLRVAGKKPTLHWIKADGKEQKSVPAAVKQNFADDLKELKQAAKDIEKMLPAQSARIEQTYLQQKEWDYPVWEERYLNHPLVGTLTRRLIWQFQKGKKKAAAIWTENGFVDQKNIPVKWFDEKTSVKLWHPFDEPKTEQITAWRDWLVAHEVKQPFKQAHREVYILTDAERTTEVYSNRFAAHVLKQHQFNALCGARGWKNSLRLMVDDEFPPASLQLPHWNLRAEFWIEGIGDEYGVDSNETGTYLYLATDQVRFYHADAAQSSAHATGGGYTTYGEDTEENHPVNLEQIPPLVLSEVMRDVDLFVGVASVGNDPNWADGGPEGQYREYWHGYSFGELGSTAATRKAVLEKLIPKLKIADRCSFSDRFLIVRGDVRTYKIHLGSSNILMEPNDEYLCIVAKQSMSKGADAVFLPFEGDNMLSVILSKAMLLADDTKIKDPTILSQIKR